MVFRINTTCDISKFSQISDNNFEISFVVFMPNIITNHAITYIKKREVNCKCSAIVSGIVTLDAPVSYWPVFPPVPSNNPRPLCES